MATWGATTINIIQDTYRPPAASAGIAEIELLPDPADPGAVATVLQQGPRTRRMVSWSGWVENQAALQALLDDYYAAEVRTFTGHDSVSFDAIIMSITPGNRYFEHYLEYSCVLVEAVDI